MWLHTGEVRNDVVIICSSNAVRSIDIGELAGKVGENLEI